MGELGHIKQVVGNAAHDLADFGVGIISVTEPLQMGECIAPHVSFNVNAHYMAGAGHIILRSPVDQPQNQIDKRQPQHNPRRQHHAGVGSGIGQVPHDGRQHNVTQGGQGGKNQNLSVFQQIRRKPQQLRLFGFVFVHDTFLYTVLYRLPRLAPCSGRGDFSRLRFGRRFARSRLFGGNRRRAG